MGSVQEVSRTCLGSVWEVSRKCLESVYEVSRKCLGGGLRARQGIFGDASSSLRGHLP